jgi:hypothetical protein
MWKRVPRIGWRLPGVPIVGFLAAALNLVASPSLSRAEEDTRVAEIRALDSAVEITVTSSEPFPVRALPPVLMIGDARFARSRHPDDGSLGTLIFVIPIEDFALLNDGDPIRVGYGLSPAAEAKGAAAGQEWDLGRLDKSGLQP